MSWLQERLNSGGRNLGNSTLHEFHIKTSHDLSVVASDLTSREMLVLNHRTAPTCPTIWAVRMSKVSNRFLTKPVFVSKYTEFGYDFITSTH